MSHFDRIFTQSLQTVLSERCPDCKLVCPWIIQQHLRDFTTQ